MAENGTVKPAYIKIFIDYLDLMEPLSDAERGRLITALLKYADTGELPTFKGNERFIFPAMKANLDRQSTAMEELSKQRSQAGKLGGRPRKNSSSGEAKKAIAFSESKKSYEKEEEKEKEKEKDYKKENIKEKSHKYGEYKNVLLSDEELEKLKSEFPTDWEERIERLSAYIASTGKSYKNHLATIRNWAKKDEMRKTGSFDTDDFFNAALARSYEV